MELAVVAFVDDDDEDEGDEVLRWLLVGDKVVVMDLMEAGWVVERHLVVLPLVVE